MRVRDVPWMGVTVFEVEGQCICWEMGRQLSHSWDPAQRDSFELRRELDAGKPGGKRPGVQGLQKPNRLSCILTGTHCYSSGGLQGRCALESPGERHKRHQKAAHSGLPGTGIPGHLRLKQRKQEQSLREKRKQPAEVQSEMVHA